jgi:DNA adenine methylase
MIKPIIRYVGSKYKLGRDIIIPRLISMHTDEQEYREPFYGSGILGCNLLECYPSFKKVWLNDYDARLINMHDVIKHKPDQLIKELCKIIPSGATLKINKIINMMSLDEWPHIRIDDLLIWLAAHKISLHKISRDGKGLKSGGVCSDYVTRYNIPEMTKSIRELSDLYNTTNTKFTCVDFTQVINKGGKALIYLDPPYVDQGNRVYEYGFSLWDHYRLMLSLKGCKHTWLMSYDDHPYVRDMYKGWCRIEEISTKGIYSTERARDKEKVTHELLISRK